MFQLRFGELEGEILGKTFNVASDRLVKRLRWYFVQAGQVRIYHYFLSPNDMDQGFDRLG